jgi:hypothetical protein
LKLFLLRRIVFNYFLRSNFALSLLAFFVSAAAKPPPKQKRAQTCRSITAKIAVLYLNLKGLNNYLFKKYKNLRDLREKKAFIIE